MSTINSMAAPMTMTMAGGAAACPAAPAPLTGGGPTDLTASTDHAEAEGGGAQALAGTALLGGGPTDMTALTTALEQVVQAITALIGALQGAAGGGAPGSMGGGPDVPASAGGFDGAALTAPESTQHDDSDSDSHD